LKKTDRRGPRPDRHRLTATDAKLTPSTDVHLFRIKIWDRETDLVVYDNKMGQPDDGYDGTEIGGGNIKIHKAK
jgi:hypothetical protein